MSLIKNSFSVSRALIFAHYDPQDVIDDYILFNLKCLRPYYSCIVFVTTSKLPLSEQQKIFPLVDQFSERMNIGSDFYSYRQGLLQIQAFSDLHFDQIVLMNDSVYGPTCNLDSIFLDQNLLNADFYGLTDSYCLHRHVQSYFIAFNKHVFKSEKFRKFWIDLEKFESRFDIVYNYEIGLSRLLFKEKFKAALLFKRSFKDSLHEVFFILKSGVPLFAKKLIVHFFADYFRKSFLEKRPYLFVSGWFFALNPTHHLFESVSKKVPYIKVSYFKENPIQFEKKLDSAGDVIPSELRHLIKNHIRRVTKSDQSHK